MPRDEQGVRDFSERMAAALIGAGFPRMPARVLMALTVAESDGMTAVEIADWLDISAGAVSGAVRYLQTLGMVRRVSQQGSRRDLYELPFNAWYTASMRTNPLYEQFIALARVGIEVAGGPDSIVGERLVELSDFYVFLQKRLPQLLREWDEGRHPQ